MEDGELTVFSYRVEYALQDLVKSGTLVPKGAFATCRNRTAMAAYAERMTVSECARFLAETNCL